MSEFPSTERPFEIVRDLIRITTDRARAEVEIESGFEARDGAIESGFSKTLEKLTNTYESESGSVERKYEKVKRTERDRYQHDHEATQAEYFETHERVKSRFEAEKESAKRDVEESRWEANTIFEAGVTGFKQERREAERRGVEAQRRSGELRREATEFLRNCRFEELLEQPKSDDPPDDEEPSARLEESFERAEGELIALKSLLGPKLLGRRRLLVIQAGVWLVTLAGSVPLAHFFRHWILGLIVGIPIAWGLSAVVTALLRRRVRGMVDAAFAPLSRTIREIELWGRRCVASVNAQSGKRREAARNQRRKDLEKVESDHRQTKSRLKRLRDAALHSADEKYPALLRDITTRRDEAMQAADEKYPKAREDSRVRYEAQSSEVHQDRHDRSRENRARYEQEWRTGVRAWESGLEKLRADLRTLELADRDLFPAWDDSHWSDWPVAEVTPPAIRFGSVTIDVGRLEHGKPKSERLRPVDPSCFSLPALVGFPEDFSLLYKAAGEGRGQAESSLQTVMLRLLTTVPAGKLRFTIIDPVGLGQSFAAFMHLADYDELLVNSRIWTEPGQIDQRLADLTAHMENVIQKYLRNEFATIEEYNAQAGEIAEPFRILVVANFPANFNEGSARRLVSIAKSGARCGVHTLVSVDAGLPLPHGFDLDELRGAGALLEWRDDRFVWPDTDFSQWPLRLDEPPPAEFVTRVLKTVGERALQAGRVEVPFAAIAPAVDQWWTRDSRDGVVVPLGPSGATKLQNLRLGQGTSQHVLIAGKTGSGKSSLLHALITNAALLFAPDELELYLVDFKKGVEFKTYAAYGLPHARVVAVESEREFGLSVMQRLDREMTERGDRFRELGVQDLRSFRDAQDAKPLPRILFIVDEFQELFTEDDKIAQEASLLLDRLVRQGRAFGIHVLLGSQTLGGAYSLARSTIGQMAVRIALQCGDADARLILAEENSAARLLHRPGEAIYNDANGMVEGNNPFQVAWLPDHEREHYLEQIRALARERNFEPTCKQIVFEGNKAADVARNEHLERMLCATAPTDSRAWRVWLGEAVAIKDPTDAVFRPQSGGNLIFIGQQGDLALAMMATALVSLAAQVPIGAGSTKPRFYLLDGSTTDAPSHGYLARFEHVLPHPVRSVALRDVPEAIAELAEEVERRSVDVEAEVSPLYLFVYDLQRFRALRKDDEEFGFSRGGEKPNPAKQFASILKEGPAVGVFTLVWCDTANTLSRTFDRQTIREFENRILFQMSAGDSSNLIDSPAANKLGIHRALLYSEDQGRIEKFLPYGLPDTQWLEHVREALGNRARASQETV